jgi:putative addiction module component (TIGR02574 family)
MAAGVAVSVSADERDGNGERAKPTKGSLASTDECGKILIRRIEMSKRGQALLKAVLELSREERELFADELLASLDDMTEAEFQAEFQAELLRRRDECLNDPNSTVPWTALKNISC